jgi:drug/metabolite transporter (DMT)-like permease
VASSRRHAWLLLAGVVLVWGAHWTVAKVGLESIPPFSYGVLRLGVAIVVLAALMRGAGRLRPPARADLPIVLSYGLLGIAIAISTMNLALPFVEAGRASILSYTLPLWVVPIVAVVARSRPSRAEVTGLALGLVGLALLLNPAAIDWTSPQVLVGVGLLLLGAVTGAAALVHVRAHRWTGTPFDVQVWQLLVALVPIGLLAVILERDEWAAVDWDLGIVLIVLYSGALATAFAYWGSQSIVRALGPTTTSIAYLAVPVVGIVTGAIVLAEPITLLDVGGLVVTSAGVIVVVTARSSEPQDAASVATGEERAAAPPG